MFHLRLCKLCDDGVVVKGEYGLTATLFAHGFNIATLMGMYPPDLDWRDERHWNCNNNVHPSRHGASSARVAAAVRQTRDCEACSGACGAWQLAAVTELRLGSGLAGQAPLDLPQQNATQPAYCVPP